MAKVVRYKRISVKITEERWLELQGVQPKTGQPANVFVVTNLYEGLDRLKEKAVE